jgi:hypothetical protein
MSECVFERELLFLEARYPVLSEEKLRQLPWNRLKNIMARVRAFNSGIGEWYGIDYHESCDPPEELDESMFSTWEERKEAIKILLAPHREYFKLLKKCAAELPNYQLVESPRVKRHKRKK